ncbi:MAG: HEAT repeat domain-containing protein [Gemmataceae bacterium]
MRYSIHSWTNKLLGDGSPVALARSALLFAPAVVVALFLFATGGNNLVLLLALVAELIILTWALMSRRVHAETIGPVLILLHVIALSGLVVSQPKVRPLWVVHLAQAALLVVPVWLFGVQILQDSGATALRHARQLANRLAQRSSWPSDLNEIRQLPEVQAFREALHIDAAPALELLTNPCVGVRLAALTALEFRSNWRPGQTGQVLHFAQRAIEPEVRTAAINALANTEDRMIVEALGELMRDPQPMVRRAATEAILWNTESRWPWLRNPVRLALAAPVCQEDGALRLTGQPLCPEAVNDFTAWAAEKGVSAYRAALTLSLHYNRLLSACSDPEQVEKLRKQLVDPRTPPMLRLELARLLHHYRELDEPHFRSLLDPSMPAPVRLIAVEALLGRTQCPEALAALHDLARLPNREIAMLTADVIQRRLGVDMGLPRDMPMPPVNSRIAAEVARRVQMWASHHEVNAQQAKNASALTDSRVDLG